MSETTPSQPVARAVLRGLVARQAVPLAVLAALALLLHDRLAGLDLGGALRATRDIPLWSWAAAGTATLVSFAAVGRYDAVIHRWLATGVDGPAARRAGIAAIATAQTVGFGLLTGTLARWRMLPDQSLWQAAQVTLAVTVSFMAGLAVVAALVLLGAGAAVPLPRALAWAVLAAAACVAAVSLWRPARLLHLALPPLRAQVAILGLVGLDTGAAALALYVLLPQGALPDPAAFLAIYLLALGAGLVGATPGGVGPFEVVCLALLPTVPEAGLLAAIAGYRLVYYGLPGALAACLLVAGGSGGGRRTAPPRARLTAPGAEQPYEAVLQSAPHAEAQLLRQGELGLLCQDRHPVAMAAAAGQSLIVLGGPLARAVAPDTLPRLAARAARQRCLAPVFYKCPARIATAARRAGWRVLRVSQEAWIDPASHDPARPQCRQLRRQLRRARAAGLRVAEAGAVLPVARMAEIAAGWARRRGGARGFSLGRFAPDHLHLQKVFLCYDERRRLVAFATFHRSRSEWALDQMCQTPGTPSGAMHLLVDAAIAAAARQGCPRLSLAAVPQPVPGWLPTPLADRIDRLSGARGLRRFKSSFAPDWRPLYMAAPGRLALLLGGIDLVDRITRSELRGPSRADPAPGS